MQRESNDHRLLYKCVTLINFLPLIKQVSQFLIKGKFFLERERDRERERERSASGLQTGGHGSARQDIIITEK